MPPAWIEQLRPGGVLLTDIKGASWQAATSPYCTAATRRWSKDASAPRGGFMPMQRQLYRIGEDVVAVKSRGSGHHRSLLTAQAATRRVAPMTADHGGNGRPGWGGSIHRHQLWPSLSTQVGMITGVPCGAG